MVEFNGGQDKEDWSKRLQAISSVFDAIRPDAGWTSRDSVYQTSKKVIQGINSDIQELRNEAGFLFSTRSEPQDLTAQTVDLIRRWHITEHAPSLAALAAFAVENLKVEIPAHTLRALLAGSVIAEVENKLPYHNNMHYKKVLLQLMRLIAVHNDIYDGTAQVFTGNQVGILLLAACVHDLGHDGRGNTIKGVFETGRLERRAFDLAVPYLETCGMDKRDLDYLKVMLLCTDVAPLGDPANPLNQMKSAFRYHFLGQKKKMGPLNLDADLDILEKDATLTMMSLMLHEADISTSAGLDYNLTTFETTIYKKEMGQEQAFPEDVIDFLNDICQRQMLSDAGQRLYAANMARIFALGEKEIAEGNHAFPKIEYCDFLLIHHPGQGGSPSKTIN